jgi:hypothetical protein
VDDGSTTTYDNFTVEYVHFEGAGGVGSSLPPSMSTLVLEPPPLRLRRSGLFDCLVISSTETLEW